MTQDPEIQELVERLRYWGKHSTTIERQAADLIESLQAEVERDKKWLDPEAVQMAVEHLESVTERAEKAEAERDQLAGEVERLKEVVLDSSTALERAEQRVAELEGLIQTFVNTAEHDGILKAGDSYEELRQALSPEGQG